MLRTLDLNQIFQCLLESFGECEIKFLPMTVQEKATASTEINGITAINERFWIFLRANDQLVRHHEIEVSVVRPGAK
jgi:hypothetical protein